MDNRPHSSARQALNDKRLQRTAFAYFGCDYDDCDPEQQRIIYDFVMLEDALCDLIYAEHYVDEVIEELRPAPVDQSTSPTSHCAGSPIRRRTTTGERYCAGCLEPLKEKSDG